MNLDKYLKSENIWTNLDKILYKFFDELDKFYRQLPNLDDF